MKNPRVLFWFIIVFSIAALLIDLPSNFHLSLESPNLPLINKKIAIHKSISPPNINFFIAGIHIEKSFYYQRGLDLEGGTSITLKADTSKIPPGSRQDALAGAKAIIEKRINLFGVSQPTVQRAEVNGQARIIVDLPGISNLNEAVSLIGSTAQLSFWEEGATGSARIASSSALPQGLSEVLGSNPVKTNLTGKDLEASSVTFDQNTGKPQVSLVFTPQGAQKFAEITKRNVNKRVAIVLDNRLLEAPVVNQTITGGNAVITGGFTTETAKALSIQLNAGALPVPLSILKEHAIGPTLGASSLVKSLFAGGLAILTIIIFMSFIYGRLGILASCALLIYTLFVLAIFKFIPVTLTLAGIAGFILSIGMAVDANILIFERTKEELRRGRRKDMAIELGFSRAWTSIRDSNVSSIITSFILYKFGTGIVRGFALTLAIGVLVSMFSAIVITRTFLRLTYKASDH
ncbi:protein translocase subunit SecD [Patescibacteria group bacterium]|nr:protein translocase subunit SecD [Patescibacteria group bacterium]MCL5010111.1 protein translocase subunit SecD [Patescibacteria group bacterium]